jgi:hypothetical protein
MGLSKRAGSRVAERRLGRALVETPSTPFLPERGKECYVRKLIVVLGALLGALLLAQSAKVVHAAGSCSTTSSTTTCTFSPTGAEDTFVVPDGVSSVHVVATGAPGAVGKNSRLCITETERFEHR